MEGFGLIHAFESAKQDSMLKYASERNGIIAPSTLQKCRESTATIKNSASHTE